MMMLKTELRYYGDNLVRVIRLPYIGNDTEMVIILPRIRFDLSNIRENMTSEDLIGYIQNAKPINVEVSCKIFPFEGKLKSKIVFREKFNRFYIVYFQSSILNQ